MFCKEGGNLKKIWPGSPSKGRQRHPLALYQLQNSRHPCSPCWGLPKGKDNIPRKNNWFKTTCFAGNAHDVWLNPCLHPVALIRCSKFSRLPTVQEGCEEGCKLSGVQSHQHAMPHQGCCKVPPNKWRYSKTFFLTKNHLINQCGV